MSKKQEKRSHNTVCVKVQFVKVVHILEIICIFMLDGTDLKQSAYPYSSSNTRIVYRPNNDTSW